MDDFKLGNQNSILYIQDGYMIWYYIDGYVDHHPDYKISNKVFDHEVGEFVMKFCNLCYDKDWNELKKLCILNMKHENRNIKYLSKIVTLGCRSVIKYNGDIYSFDARTKDEV